MNSVVTAANLGSATTLNGFTIRNGHATDSGVGAGILASDCQASFVRCRIQDNEAQSGAGMYVSGVPSPIVVDCRFRNNVAVQFGGGVYNNRSDIALINTLIDNNTAGNQGGGFFNESPALVGVVNMINCMITDNVAANWAGIGLSGTGTVLTNCIVWGTPGICCSDSRHVG